jgi:hypothetical protein
VGSLRDPIRPSAPSTTFLSSTAAHPEQALEASAHPEAQHVEGGPPAAMVFAEFFSGDALLTQTMRDSGVRCLAPDDLATGGMDFASATQIRKLRDKLRNLRTEDTCLAIHLAPPCSTFSRARDRSALTKLGSSEFPAGVP